MSGTTTGTTPARTLDLAALRDALAAIRGRARGRTAAQDFATELAKLRRDPAVLPVLRAYEAGLAVTLTAALEQLLTARLGVDPAILAAATTTAAPAAPAGSVVGTAATGTLALAASGGTGTIAIPGKVLTAPAVGYWAEIALQCLDAAGTVTSCVVNVIVKRPSGNAVAAAAVTNRFGTEFGAAGGAGVVVEVAATCVADGATATLALTNTGTGARTVAYAVERRVAG